MSPFIAYLSISLFSPEGTVCLSKDFRFATQYLVHSNGIMNFFTYFTFNQSYRRGFLAILSRIFCPCGSMCRWKHESYVASAGAVNVGMDFDTKDVVLISMRSLESTHEHKEVENGNI